MAGLEKGLVINIYMGGSSNVDVPVVKVEPEFSKLLLRLANKDALDDDGKLKLTSDVVNFVTKKLDEDDLATIAEFLKAENRAMLSPEMKEIISEKLSLHKALK